MVCGLWVNLDVSSFTFLASAAPDFDWTMCMLGIKDSIDFTASVATMGNPAAAASSNTYGVPSFIDGSIKMSNARRYIEASVERL